MTESQAGEPTLTAIEGFDVHDFGAAVRAMALLAGEIADLRDSERTLNTALKAAEDDRDGLRLRNNQLIFDAQTWIGVGRERDVLREEVRLHGVYDTTEEEITDLQRQVETLTAANTALQNDLGIACRGLAKMDAANTALRLAMAKVMELCEVGGSCYDVADAALREAGQA